MRCPVCKAENLQGPQCRRCKADLSLLFALEEKRRRVLIEARRCMRHSEWQAAAKSAEAANWLRGDEDSRQLAAVAHLLGRDFAAAWQCYQSWRTLKQIETGSA
ncbi:MAG TPA: hypothetical protein VE999_00470 [Gemmataceae bacterium]|nr:hypothetical protein [Gemmataceae bacterium]